VEASSKNVGVSVKTVWSGHLPTQSSFIHLNMVRILNGVGTMSNFFSKLKIALIFLIIYCYAMIYYYLWPGETKRAVFCFLPDRSYSYRWKALVLSFPSVCDMLVGLQEGLNFLNRVEPSSVPREWFFVNAFLRKTSSKFLDQFFSDSTQILESNTKIKKVIYTYK